MTSSQQRGKGKAKTDSRLLSFRRGHCSRAPNAKTTSRPREGAFALRYSELLAESVLALSRRRDRSSHSRSARSPPMFNTKSARSSASTVYVHAVASEDVVKREDPDVNGLSETVYHDVDGDGCCPANSKVRLRPRRARRLFVPRSLEKERTSRATPHLSRATKGWLLTPPVTRLLPAADEQEIAR
jgi:hypothetical protein